MHGAKTNVSMEASERLAVPRTVETIVLVPDKKLIGKTFKKEQKEVYALLDTVCQNDAHVAALEAKLEKLAVNEQGKNLHPAFNNVGKGTGGFGNLMNSLPSGFTKPGMGKFP